MNFQEFKAEIFDQFELQLTFHYLQLDKTFYHVLRLAPPPSSLDVLPTCYNIAPLKLVSAIICLQMTDGLS